MGSKKSNNSESISKNRKKMKKKSTESIEPPVQGKKSGSGIITDSRFASVQSDPRFQKVPKHKTKVEIDSRFDRIFNDRKFAGSSAPVDKRGKPKKKRESENFLKNYYRIEENKDEKEEEEEAEPERKKIPEAETESSDESEAFEVEDDELDGLESDTTSDEDGDESSAVYLLDDDESEAPEENVPEIDKETRRLAVVNMDWRHVKATDLYMMLSSFLPKNGQIVSVAVYPSEFGLQRMKEEDLRGPVDLFNDVSDNSDADDDELDNEKLRAYEKSKLRYYYAVVECDSVATADYLYKTCDRTEFERSSNVLDLRFIPDSMEFKHPPRDVATEAPTNYEGLNFHTQALQQSKIHLSWDEDEPDRAKTLKRKLNSEQLEELELKEYLASSESESDEDEDTAEDKAEKKRKKRDMYRALVNSGPAGNGSDEDDEEKDDDDAQEMEVTFNTGLDELSKKIVEKKSRKNETVWEAHLRQKREKKKLRKNWSNDSSDDENSDGDDQEAVEEPDDFFVEDEPPVKKHRKSGGESSKSKKREGTDRRPEATEAELELLLADDNIADTGVKGYNMKRLKVKGKGKDRKKGKEKTIDEDKIPSITDDPRFSVIFTSPEFAMDPTDPQFKRSATYARQVATRKQKLNEGFAERDNLAPPEPQATADEQVKSDDQSLNKKYELSTEIRSVKLRCQQIKLPSNERASLTRDDSPKSINKKGKKIRDNDLNSMLKSVKRHSLNSKEGKSYKPL